MPDQARERVGRGGDGLDHEIGRGAHAGDPNSDTDASWSPSSTSIVYSTDYHAPSGRAGTNLFIVSAAADGAKVRLTSQCYSTEHRHGRPTASG
jgi:Tol biopolymer transport system component